MDRGWYFRLAIVVGSSVLGFLALWPSVDQWVPCPDIVKETFDNQINPGLDIKGGLRLMYEVEVDEYIRDRRDRLAEQVQRQCGVLIGVVAIVFNVMSIRRLFAADHRYKWWAGSMNVAVIVLLVILFVVDSQTLLG